MYISYRISLCPGFVKCLTPICDLDKPNHPQQPFNILLDILHPPLVVGWLLGWLIGELNGSALKAAPAAINWLTHAINESIHAIS